ncbi:hypothetical protein KFE98_02580 [bacterium SCSIO 12741]|nr:hypothetical protein KFE98_02580 [bacterium SCSIO 12741]
MNKSILLLPLFILISCVGESEDLKTYNQFLGQEKAAALDAGMDSFHEFLADNFTEHSTNGERTKAFLKRLTQNHERIVPDTNWKFNTQKNRQVLELLETSGLRKEIRLYGYEDYSYEPDAIGSIKIELEEEETFPVLDQEDSSIAASQQEARYSQILEKQQNHLDSALYLNIHGKYLQGLKLIQKRDKRIQDYIEAVEAV